MVFTRQVVRAASVPFGAAELRRRFAPVAARIGAEPGWTVTDTAEQKSVVLLVSKKTRRLHDLLGRIATGELPARLAAVIGNHAALRDVVRAHGATRSRQPVRTRGRRRTVRSRSCADRWPSSIPTPSCWPVSCRS